MKIEKGVIIVTKDKTIKKLEEKIIKLKEENDKIKYLVYKCSESVLNNR